MRRSGTGYRLPVQSEARDKTPRVEPANREIAATAARLRAQHGTKLRLPDALVVATAVELGAAILLTTDAGWPSLPIHVTVVGGSAAP